MIALFGGAAGAGKTTVARGWCRTRPKAVHIELDAVRDLIIAGRVDPQSVSRGQARQYAESVRACCTLARSFAEDGYDVAVDDVLDPPSVAGIWKPALEGYDAGLVILHPALAVVLARASGRDKRVAEHHIRSQHAAMRLWPAELCVDSGKLSVEETVVSCSAVLERLLLSRPG